MEFERSNLPPLPEAFIKLLDSIIPDHDREMVDASFSEAKDLIVRRNPLIQLPQAPIKDVLESMQASALQGVHGVWRVSARHRHALTHHSFIQRGALYIQGASSQAAVWAMQPQPNEEILDLAAAPGGKTSLIAAYMNNQGRIAAVEATRPRFFRLKANLERLGVRCARLYLKDGTRVGQLVPERFDRVLLDAPCSSEAQFTRLNPASWSHWNPNKVYACSILQRKLLRSAVQALKPGGVLIYSTCSISPEENELPIDWVLQQFPNLALEPFTLPCSLPIMQGLTSWKKRALHPDLRFSLRILPSRWTEAFFIARLRKAE